MKGRKASIKLRLVDIQNDGWHLLIKVRINNRVASLVVDSGASRTVLDKNRVEKFVSRKNITKHDMLSSGLGTNSMQSHMVVVKKIEIGKVKIKNESVVLLDLSHVNSSYTMIGLKPIDGVLGNDFLIRHYAIIDFGKKKLELKY